LSYWSHYFKVVVILTRIPLVSMTWYMPGGTLVIRSVAGAISSRRDFNPHPTLIEYVT
jgi:hypothetical protein